MSGNPNNQDRDMTVRRRDDERAANDGRDERVSRGQGLDRPSGRLEPFGYGFVGQDRFGNEVYGYVYGYDYYSDGRGNSSGQPAGERGRAGGEQRAMQDGGSRGRAGGEGHAGKGPKGYRRSDARIREDVSDRLTDDPHIDASDIEVRVENGEVTLSGQVGDRRQKRHAEDIIENIAGVNDVHNRISVRRDQGAAGSDEPDRPSPQDQETKGKREDRKQGRSNEPAAQKA